MIKIHSIYVGQPQTIKDEHGIWQSSIYRDRVEGPIKVALRGLAGDRVTDTRNHGKPNQAICCHSLEHYHFWNDQYGMTLQPGAVGENWTLEDADEAEICLNDVYRVGTARVQISGPRVPCFKQSRRVGRADWIDLTLKELRTGIYLSVLTPGTVQAGDEWELEDRPHPRASVTALNRCIYHECDIEIAAHFLAIDDLDPYWRKRLERTK